MSDGEGMPFVNQVAGAALSVVDGDISVEQLFAVERLVADVGV